jgi:protease-4
VEPADSSANFFITAGAAAIGAAVAVVLTTFGMDYLNRSAAWQPLESGPDMYTDSTSCNVLGIQIHGTIVGSRSEIPVMDTIVSTDGTDTIHTPNYTVASDIVYYLASAASDPSIKAVLIDVDSGGGDGQAGEEIALAVGELGKPSVAVIHGLGLSAAYWAASAADEVFAYKTSTVGSIGATYSYVNNYEKNKKEGLTYEALSSGPFKDMFSPDKQLTAAERALIIRDLEMLHDTFVADVAKNRKMPPEKVALLADGSSVLGTAALENGLIDRIGSSGDAVTHIERLIGEPASFCWQ